MEGEPFYRNLLEQTGVVTWSGLAGFAGLHTHDGLSAVKELVHVLADEDLRHLILTSRPGPLGGDQVAVFEGGDAKDPDLIAQARITSQDGHVGARPPAGVP